MKKAITSILLAGAVALNVAALDVTINPGTLESNVTDHNITTLKVNGALNAADFRFIRDNLTKLQTLNLSNAQIASYQEEIDGISYLYRSGTLPAYALFGMTSLKTVNLSSSTRVIADGAFAGCTSLATLSISTAVDSIGNNAFNDCRSLTSITIPVTAVHLGTGTFARSGLKTVTFKPNAVIDLPDETFLDCKSLTTVTLGKNLRKIGIQAFAGCTSLKQPTIESGSVLAYIDKLAFTGSALTSTNFLSVGSVSAIGDYAFAQTDVTTAQFPATVNNLGDGVLLYNTALTTTSLPATLTTVPDFTFTGDTRAQLGNILSDNVTVIGDYAFYGNTATTDFIIPAAVNHIGTRAMAGMIGLRNLESKPLTPPQLGEDVWQGVTQANVYNKVAPSSRDYYASSQQWKYFDYDGALIGDVNLDGSVNAGDVATIYSVILGTDLTHQARADVNGDGEVNAADISSEYVLILNPSSAPRRYLAYNAVNNDVLTAVAIEISANREATMNLRLNNEADYTSFQLDIITPQGLTVDAVTLSNRAPQEFGLTYAYIDDNTMRVIAVAPEAVIPSGEGTILALNIVADDTFSGNDVINVSNILFVEPDIACHHLEAFSVPATGITGIKQVNADNDNGPVDVFNMQGQLLKRQVDREHATDDLPAGIYIIGGKKVLVK